MAAAQWETVTSLQAEVLGAWKDREALAICFQGFVVVFRL